MSGIFEVEIGGKVYEIEAPNQSAAMQAVQRMSGARSRENVSTRDTAMGSDGVSGETIRANAAGDTRATMRPQDIVSAYDVAQERGDRAEQQAMARAYVQRERADSPIMTGIGDRVRQIAKGVPVLGKSLDEANAATEALMGGNYERRLDYERARDATFEAARPKESLGLQIGGGVASGVAAAPAIGGIIGNAATRGGAALRGLGIGAGIGAVDGFADGQETVENRAMSGLFGAGVGGAIGAAAPAVGAGINKGVNRIAEALASRQTPVGMSRDAMLVLQRTLDNEGLLGQRGAQAMAQSGPSGMIADISPGTMALLDTAMQRGGRAVAPAREAIEQRAAAASGQIDDALTRALGKPTGIATAQEAVRKGTQGARSSAYETAYATPIDYAAPQARELQDLLSRVPGSAIAQANQELKMLGHSSRQIMADIADDGSVTFRQLPDVQQIDAITRNLQSMARMGDGKGIMGGNTPAGRAAGNLAGGIRDNLKALVPAYGEALETAADAIGRAKGVELGAGALKPGMARDEFARELAGMTGPERAAVAQGVRGQIDEVLANVRSSISDPNVDARQATAALNQFSSEAARDKITTLVGKEQADGLFAAMDEARRALSLRAGVSQNSKTFARQSVTGQIDEMNAPGPLGTFIAGGEQGGLSQGIRALARTLMGKTPQAIQSEQDQLYGELVKALTGQRGADGQKLITQLGKRSEASDSAQAMARALGLIGGGAAAGGGYQAISPMRRTAQ